MIQFAKQLHEELEQSLHAVTLQPTREAIKAKASFEVVEFSLHKLKDFIKSYEFKNNEEEIHFFKEIKPSFYHLLIYYGELAFIESNKPIGDRKTMVIYLRKVIELNCEFIERHKLLHTYYHLGHTSEDEIYFMRNSVNQSLYPEDSVDLDATFSTKSSAVLSKLLAFGKVNDHLVREIEYLKRGTDTVVLNGEKKKDVLVWTDSKAALVELAYALLARGSANYGKADLNQIMQTLEMAFNIQTGNYYRTYVDLSNRKKGRTPYLDSLKENLERRMDENL